MTVPDSYVRDLADRMGLRDWTIRVDRGEPDSPDRADGQSWGASSEPMPGRKYGVITLGASVDEASPEDQRETIVHELVHLHHASLVDQIRNDLDAFVPTAAFELLNASFTRNLEYAVDGLAEVIAPFMPLPPKAKGAK